MKNTNTKLVPFTAYSFLSFGFGITITISVLSVLLPIIFAVTGDQMPSWYDIKVNLETAANSTGNFGSYNYSIHNIEGLINISGGSGFSNFLNSLIPVLIFSSLTCVIFLLRKIIKNVYEGNHFLKSNSTYMKIIASMVIVVPHIVALIQNIVVDSFPKDLVINGMKVSKLLPGPVNIFSFSLVPNYLILGLLLFIFAEVFKEGKNIKEEIDLTV